MIDNASALVETDGKHEQVLLGHAGGRWRHVEADRRADDRRGQSAAGRRLPAHAERADAGDGAGGNAPSDEMQKLMAELEKLDREADTSAAGKAGGEHRSSGPRSCSAWPRSRRKPTATSGIANWPTC